MPIIMSVKRPVNNCMLTKNYWLAWTFDPLMKFANVQKRKKIKLSIITQKMTFQLHLQAFFRRACRSHFVKL